MLHVEPETENLIQGHTTRKREVDFKPDIVHGGNMPLSTIDYVLQPCTAFMLQAVLTLEL